MDDVYREWFDSNTVSVKVDLQNANDFLTKIEIAELTGAPKGSTIHVKQDGAVISFAVSNEIFSEDMYRYLVAENNGFSYHLKNVVLVLRKEYMEMGIGPRCVIMEIHAAANLLNEVPINSIKVSAVGNYDSFFWENEPLRGYYVWARMGFDAKIPPTVLAKLAQPYQNLTLVSDLMRTVGGRSEWLVHGDSVDLEFDLKRNSVSWLLLSQYMSEKGIKL